MGASDCMAAFVLEAPGRSALRFGLGRVAVCAVLIVIGDFEDIG